MSARLFGLAVVRKGVVVVLRGAPMRGAAGGVQGGADFAVVESGMPGGDGQRGQVGRLVGVEGAVRGPEQARVTVALVEAGDPADQAVDFPRLVVLPTGAGLGRLGRGLGRLGFE